MVWSLVKICVLRNCHDCQCHRPCSTDSRDGFGYLCVRPLMHFSRALRALAASNADIVGPSDSFLVGFETGQFYRSKILLSSSTLDPSFIQLVNYNYTTLDVYLPLLLLPSSSTLSISYVSLMSTLHTVALRSW